MSGMDRLSDDKLKRMADGLFNALEMQLLDDLGSMARELLAHRRASQAAPAPQKPVAWAETDHKGKVIGVSMNQYPCHPTPLYAAPTPSDGLREAVERAAVVAECAFDDRPRDRSGHPSHMDWEDGYLEGTRAAAEAIRAALSASPAQEGGE